MIFKITINGLTYEKDIPTSWDQVPFKMLWELDKCQSTAETLSVITGVPVADIEKAKIKGADKLLAVLAFMQTKIDTNYIPKDILGFRVPENLSSEQVQVYEDIKEEIREAREKEENISLKYPLFIAMLLSPGIHGEYDYEKSKILARQFENAPVGEVLAIGNFILLKLKGLKEGINLDFPKRPTPLKKFRLALSVSLRRMVSWARWRLWKRRQAILERNSVAGQ